MRTLHVFLVWPTLVLLAGCLESPFGDNDITGGTQAINGSVALNNGASAKDAFVWLDTFNAGSRADANGAFRLILPPAAGQPGGGISGAFDLYFYMANCRLNTANVTTRNGVFVYDAADLNKNGALRAKIVLSPFLGITTQLSPARVAQSDTAEAIDLRVTLQTLIGDTATVIFPQSVIGTLGAVIFKSTNTGATTVFQRVAGGSAREVIIVGRTPVVRGFTFRLREVTPRLAPGTYEVVPYLLIAHENIPSLLLQTLGPSTSSLGPDYLKMPFVRDGGRFEITD